VFANRWLWGAVALSVLLQVAVVHVGFLAQAFGTSPLSLTQWAVCLGMASSVLWVTELEKVVVRRASRAAGDAGPGQLPTGIGGPTTSSP
jgi:magnesium-transporting ATPase (P-type)